MAIIAYWSSTKKQTGQSMSLAAVATDMAIEHNHKILIISTQYDDNTLELCFGSQDKNKKLINKLVGTTSATSVDNGIEGLARMAVSGRMTPEIIQNYTHVIYRNRLEILYGYKKNPDRPSEEEYLKIKEKYKEIIQNAARAYDIVFVDLNKTSEDSVVKDILEIADVIVYNVEQKINMINEFEEIREKLDNKKKIM